MLLMLIVFNFNNMFLIDQLKTSVPAACLNLLLAWATGTSAEFINGIWERSKEVTAGLPVYFKRDRPEYFLEYFAPGNRWFIRTLAGRGTGNGWAYVDCPAGVALDSCTSIWGVLVNGAWVEQPSLKVLTHT